MVPICDAMGGATASVADAVYDFYVGKMTQGFAEVADELDGILRGMHGAMVTESQQDPETDAVRGIRQAVGRDIPIMVTFDLHGNKDDAILAETTAVFGYHSSPHVDMAETGRRAARIMVRTLNKNIRPVAALEKPGIVVPSVFSATTVNPAKEIIACLRKWEKHPGVLDVTVLFGFTWSDVRQLGMSMIAVTDNDPELARQVVDDLSGLAQEKRKALTGREKTSLFSVKEGVSRAIELVKTADKPIEILDHVDRTCDTTFVLRELVDQGAKGVAHPLLNDPEAAKACLETGVGGSVDMEIGAGTRWRDGGPLQVNLV